LLGELQVGTSFQHSHRPKDCKSQDTVSFGQSGVSGSYRVLEGEKGETLMQQIREAGDFIVTYLQGWQWLAGIGEIPLLG
jgi:hypothetical protein